MPVTLPIVAQDPRFGGGLRTQTEAFWSGAVELGRSPELHYVSLVEGVSPRLRLRLRPRPERHDGLSGTSYPAILPELAALNHVANARLIGNRLRGGPPPWVVATSAPYGAPALAAGRPYACWLGTGLESEWSARHRALPFSRRLALTVNRRGLLELERRVLAQARFVYATSPASRAALADAGRLSLEALAILPIPVDVERFRPIAEEVWEATLDRPTIVFVGRAADPRKNVAMLLEAFRVLRDRLPDVRLRLVGERPTVPLPDGVEAAGYVPDVAAELAHATVFVLPSLQEGFGIVVAEALAAGVPAVVTPSGGPEELVRSSGGGVVADAVTAEALAAAIEDLLASRVQLLAARRSGRAYVEQEHSPSRFGELLSAALARLDEEAK